MKKLTFLITSLLLITPLYAYDLTETDRLLIDSFQPKMQQMVEQETEKFESILAKLEVMMPLFEIDSRVYVVLDYLQGVMVSLIPEEPTLVETLDLTSLFSELEEIGSQEEDDVVQEASSDVPDTTEVVMESSQEEPFATEVDMDDSSDDEQEIGEYEAEDGESSDEDEDEEFDLSDQGFEFEYELENEWYEEEDDTSLDDIDF